jgi:hypothetical protein
MIWGNSTGKKHIKYRIQYRIQWDIFNNDDDYLWIPNLSCNGHPIPRKLLFMGKG